jgi:hypothetical protein
MTEQPPPEEPSMSPKDADTDVEAGVQKPTLVPRKSSVLATSDDPFALRDGKTLLWKDINMTLKGEKGEPDKKLLEDVWGEVPEKVSYSYCCSSSGQSVVMQSSCSKNKYLISCQSFFQCIFISANYSNYGSQWSRQD